MNELDNMAYLGLNLFWIPLMIFFIIVFAYHMITGKNLYHEIWKIITGNDKK